MLEIANWRREYTRSGLRRSGLTADPLQLLTRWIQQAHEASLSDANVVVVATVNKQGEPQQRMMLLKQYGEEGFVLYTHLQSRKAAQLRDNPHVSLLFPWHPLDRQVIVSGQAEQLPECEAVSYFQSRPRESQLAAWASPQSQPVPHRAALEQQFLTLQRHYAGQIVPKPPHWGGFRVRATSIEFWQGGRYRLHDRFLYQRLAQGWTITRLAP